MGIASGFNIGIQKLITQEHLQWIALFDQDSEVLPHYLDTVQDCFASFGQKEKLAVIGCNYLDLNTGKHSEPITRQSLPYFLKTTVISSGSLIPISGCKIIGPFVDSLFIDHVDDEYCLRARGLGYFIIQTTKPILNHKIGSSELRRFLWRTAYPMNQPAFRWYFVIRNFCLLARKYFLSENPWVRHAGFAIFKRFIKMVLYEDRRPEKLKSVFKGFMDSFKLNL